VQGSGANGRVMKDDVLKAAQAPCERAASGRQHARDAHRPAWRRAGAMTPLRKRVAERLLQAQSTAAILTTFNEVDMSAVMAPAQAVQREVREEARREAGLHELLREGHHRGAQDLPRGEREHRGRRRGLPPLLRHRRGRLGQPGLVVPILRDADQKSMAELEKNIADFGGRAKNDKLTLPELQGGTFTITNGGIFGSMLSTPILNPPQTGILGMHNIVERAVVRDGRSSWCAP
jgi:2-oxoglutarate dehydrogenase E2 component (dihydrolipoamide succinyltransferase)